MDFSLLCCMATIPDSLALVTFTRFPSYWNAIVKASIPSIGYLMGFWSCCARRRMLCWRQNLLILLGGWLTWQLFPKPIAKEGVAAQRASPIALLFEGKQPCFSSDATAGGLQQLPKFTQSPTVDPFFLSLIKITSSGVAYFSWKKINSFMLSFDMQGNMNFQFSQWYEILNFLDQIKNTTSISKIVLFSYILFSWIKKWNYYLVKVY